MPSLYMVFILDIFTYNFGKNRDFENTACWLSGLDVSDSLSLPSQVTGTFDLSPV